MTFFLQRKGIWAGASLLALYVAYLGVITIWAGSATVTPVELCVPDILLGEDEPLEAHATAFFTRTGRPASGVLLRFVFAGLPQGPPRELDAVTGDDGRAGITLEAHGPYGATVSGKRIAVTIGQSRWALASPWPARNPHEKRALADILVARPRMRILLVDLDGLASQGGGGPFSAPWPVTPPPALLEKASEESRLRGGVLYVVDLEERLEQGAKAWLEASGLPEGALVLVSAGKAKGASLQALAQRLRGLETSADMALAGPGREEPYSRAFPGINVMPYEP